MISSIQASSHTQEQKIASLEMFRQNSEQFMNGWEKLCDGCKNVGEWCKEHWKIIVTVSLVIIAITIIVCTAGAALGPIATILVGAAKGLLLGAITGGLIGRCTMLFRLE